MLPRPISAVRCFVVAVAACAFLECGILRVRSEERAFPTSEFRIPNSAFPSIVPVHFDVAPAQADKYGDAHSISRPRESYISVWQIALTIVLFILWVKTTAWINHDCQMF